jgi:hypothetical protein
MTGGASKRAATIAAPYLMSTAVRKRPSGRRSVPKISIFGTPIIADTKQRRCWVSEPSFPEGIRNTEFAVTGSYSTPGCVKTLFRCSDSPRPLLRVR